MPTAEQKAPGCFGAASVFSMDSAVCQGCVAFKECGDAAIETLQAIKTALDVRDLLARHTAARQRHAAQPSAPPAPAVDPAPPVAQPKVDQAIVRKTPMQRVVFDISAAQQAVIDRITASNKKAGEQAVSLARNNRINDMHAMLPQRVNPFATSGPGYLRVACDLLLHGGFTKASLKTSLMQAFNWTDGTAASHVTLAMVVLVGFKVADVSSGKIVLHPDLICNN